MSRNSRTIVNEDVEEDEIEPSELIDTQENKPKITQPIESVITEESPGKMNLTYKQVSKLTNEEKDYLINLYKNGGENDLYKVYFYKNGTNKIVKRKQPPKYNTTKRLLESQKPTMTNEQILLEHVIDLETKFATLYQKHKKLKKNYKSLQEDIYCDDNEDSNAKQVIAEEVKQKPVEQPKEEPQKEEPKQEQSYEDTYQSTQNEYQNNYLNRFRRPQKGYRNAMAQMIFR